MKKVFVISLLVILTVSLAAANLTSLRPSNGNSVNPGSRPVNWIETDSGLPQGIGIGQISVGMNDQDALWAHAIDATGAISDQFTRSTDGGQTWTAGTFNAGNGLSQLFAIDDMTCWAVFNTGADQGLYKTTDGGVNWVNMNAGYGASSFANVIHFFDDMNGFAQGDPVGGYYELYTTDDGGDNWTRVPEANIPAPTTGEYGITGNYDAIGNSIWWGTNQGRIFYSTDMGLSWDASLTAFGNTTVVNATFADEDYGIAYRSYLDMGIEPAINVTTDGGANWTNVNVTGDMYARWYAYVPGTDMTYISSSSELGFEGCSYSEDGGNTWITLNSGDAIQALAFLDVETGWAGSWAGATSGGMYIFDGNLNVQTGTVEGTITDTDEGFAIEGATVSLGTFSTTTDENGFYSMILDIGMYTLTAEIDGYETYTQNDVEILEDQTTTVDFTMQNLYLPPEGLTANYTHPNVILQWSDPAGTYALTGFKVYRDGTELTQITANLYIDANVPAGTHTYYVTAVYGTHESVPSNEVIVEVVNAGNNLVNYEAELLGNYPNPFNPQTEISFAVSEPGTVRIDIFNIKGEKIKTIMNTTNTAGQNSVTWLGVDDDGNSVSSGIYFYKMKAGGRYTSTRKMIMLK
ncbi:MAG: carboxypeptidase regulatory-like domain-containing protein [Candidatus Cloacimonetes bacterium]|nr:carboxypeptidase regulatory-like domain-containing protein [Candidatus Cloacimonadota bacterium]MCF7815120.1 carboxypeptidase regulatory-like domain-containing protein [Candidatus Cloacimonadota bacterium]MCF7869363.1 carboxypeptidase regulatory-like domain-containing protein [Candidatus Cloacimonadota bacterium]MCF7884758.1 carboxypeptidase regulatory-like domain-containing protein [Candidatus Cloacimonadota bacterium]